MINPNELRIGNRLIRTKRDGTESIIEVTWMDLRDIYRDPDGFNNKHKPIPLTEEVLKAWGFTKEVFGFKHWNLDLYFHLDGEFFESDQLPMFIFLKHLHNLQNIYLDLTGEELKQINK